MTPTNPNTHSSHQDIVQIVDCLQAGGVVALPTETIYGLCCDPRNEAALDRLFALKQRSASKSVLCITGSRAHINQLAVILDSALPILARAWSGPLTGVLPLKPEVSLPQRVLGNGPSIALRLTPDPRIAAITQSLDIPIVATSANRSGHPFFRSATEIQAEFGRDIDLIIETDHELLQTPSTIVRFREDGTNEVLREGALSVEELGLS